MRIKRRAGASCSALLGVLTAGCVALSCDGSERSSGGGEAGTVGGATTDAPATGSGGSETRPGTSGDAGDAGDAGDSGAAGLGGAVGSGGSTSSGTTGPGGAGTGGESGSGGMGVAGEVGSGGSGIAGEMGSGGAAAGGDGGSGVAGDGGSGGTGVAGEAGTGGFAAGGEAGSPGVGVAGDGGSGSGAAGSAGALNMGGTAGQQTGGAGGEPAGTGGAAGAGGGWDWPTMLSDCDTASDEHLLAVVYDGPKVPEGMYDGDGRLGGLVSWSDSCANDAASARVLVENDFGTWSSESDASPYYYEYVSGTGTDERAHRVTKCEFFDGGVLGEPYRNPDGVKLLATYLWFVEYHQNGNFKLVATAAGPSAAEYEYYVCHTRTVYGDWGLYDEITYLEWPITVGLDGTVTMGTDEPLRTIRGQYTPNP